MIKLKKSVRAKFQTEIEKQLLNPLNWKTKSFLEQELKIKNSWPRKFQALIKSWRKILRILTFHFYLTKSKTLWDFKITLNSLPFYSKMNFVIQIITKVVFLAFWGQKYFSLLHWCNIYGENKFNSFKVIFFQIYCKSHLWSEIVESTFVHG